MKKDEDEDYEEDEAEDKAEEGTSRPNTRLSLMSLREVGSSIRTILSEEIFEHQKFQFCPNSQHQARVVCLILSDLLCLTCRHNGKLGDN